MRKGYIVSISSILVIGLLLLASCKGKETAPGKDAHQHAATQQYTCPMHPQIVQDKPGKCSICFMGLVPKNGAVSGEGVDSSLSPLLKPVSQQVVASTPTIIPESGTRIFSREVQGSIIYDTRRQTSLASRVSGRIERLYIKYNYQPVRKGQLIMEIYSPELAAAQQELLYLSRVDQNSSLLQKARQRLMLLGMGEGQIRQVIRSGKPLYRVPVYSGASGYILERSAAQTSAPTQSAVSGTSTDAGGSMGAMGAGGSTMGSSSASTSNATGIPAESSPVLIREGQYVSAGQSIFTIYNNNSLVAEFAFEPSLAAQIKRGQKLVFRPTAEPQTVYAGTIGLIQPTFRNGSNFTIARVYLNDHRFAIGQLLTANIPIVARGWWVPKSAVVQLGATAVVFKKEGTVFQPKNVQTGATLEGIVQITGNIGGWEIAQNASYLVDSESFIRTASDNQIKE
jgi:hypothetical protein